jgi:hypothetical protein
MKKVTGRRTGLRFACENQLSPIRKERNTTG